MIRSPIKILSLVVILLCPFQVTFAVVENIALVKLGLEELQHKLESLQIGADEVASNKIEMAANEARRLLRELEEIESGVVADGNEALDEVIRSAHKLSSDLGGTLESIESRAYVDVNATLANLNQTLDEFPTIDVQPYIAAIVPPRVDHDISDRRISLYGYFPADDERDVEISVNGKKVTHTRQSSGIVTIGIPTYMVLKEESYLDIDMSVPTRWGLFDFFEDTKRLNSTLYVQKKLPYTCNVEVCDTNPNYLVTVNANKVFTDMANTQSNASKPSVNREVNAEDLFVATINGATTNYIPKSAKIIKLNESFRTYGGCEHNRPSGSIKRWNHDSVTFSLSAAGKGPHNHKGMKKDCGEVSKLFNSGKCGKVPYFYLDGGGGTKSIISMRPTFTVNKKNQEPTIRTSSSEMFLGRKSSKNMSVAVKDDTSVHINCSFKDGRESSALAALILKKKDTEESNLDVSARVADGKLYVSTQ